MFENTEGSMENGQSRKTANIYIYTKQKKTKNNYTLDTNTCKQTQITYIRHESSYKQLEVKTIRTSCLCNIIMELRKKRHIIIIGVIRKVIQCLLFCIGKIHMFIISDGQKCNPSCLVTQYCGNTSTFEPVCVGK